jgi:hypothetical protein
MVLIVRFVVVLAYQTHAATHTLVALEGQQQDMLAMGEQQIFLWVEIFPLIHVKGRHPVRMIFVDFCRKVNKKTEVFFVFDFSDSYGHSRQK